MDCGSGRRSKSTDADQCQSGQRPQDEEDRSKAQDLITLSAQRGESWLSWKKKRKHYQKAPEDVADWQRETARQKSRGVLSSTMANTYDARQARRKMDENEDRKLEIENDGTT